mgnify:CR=1 FL=1
METSLGSIADTLNNPNQPGVIFQGMNQHRDRARKFSKTFTLIGLILIIAGFLIQVIGMLKQAEIFWITNRTNENAP